MDILWSLDVSSYCSEIQRAKTASAIQGDESYKAFYVKSTKYAKIQCPIVIPVMMVVISLYLVIAPIVDNPQIEYLYSILFMLAGAVLYIPFVYMGYVFKFMDKVTTFLQVSNQLR